MKILVIHNDYQQLGGETVAAKAQVALLRAHGLEVVTYWRDNREILQYNWSKKARFFANTIFSRQTYHEIMDLIAKERPDVAHVHNVFPLISPSVYWALKKAGVPIVQTVHNMRFLCPNGLFYTKHHICERCKYGNTLHAIRWKCYRQNYALSALYATTIAVHRRLGTFDLIDTFIALTEFTAHKLVEGRLTTADKITVLGHFLPEPLPEAGSFEHREPYLTYIGRLSPEKGVDILLEAMVGVPGITLKIAGHGPQFPELNAKARHYNIPVEFLGHVEGTIKWDLLRNGLATIVPSVCYETFSLATLESMAVGTMVIASRIGSLPHIIEDGRNGMLFEAGNSSDLHQKILRLMQNPSTALTMGHIAHNDTRKKFSLRTHYQALHQIYERAVGR